MKSLIIAYLLLVIGILLAGFHIKLAEKNDQIEVIRQEAQEMVRFMEKKGLVLEYERWKK